MKDVHLYDEDLHWITQSFADKDLERQYREWYFESTRGQFQKALLVAAAIILIYAPLEIFVVGRGNFLKEDWVVWLARFAVVTLVLIIYFFSVRIPARYLPIVISIGWTVMVLTIWIGFSVSNRDESHEYFYRFALISLGGTVVMPFVFFHSALLQLLIFFAIYYYLVFAKFSSDEVIGIWALPSFIVAAVVMMGLYAKFFSERTLRKNFVQSFQLEQARKEAERANDAKTQFLATVSHELRTPLNGILGNIRLVKLGGVDHDSVGERLDEIERSSRAMKNLIDDVLNIARIEAGTDFITLKPFELGDIFSDLHAVLQPLARSKNIELRLPHVDGPIYLNGDGGYLRHILLNILGNAVKFTRDGQVILSFEQSEGSVIFEVSDTGIGVPSDQLDEIFETFAQGSNIDVGELGGTGLGLSIVRRLVSSVGGRVLVKSKLGEGTTFQVTVPFVRTTEPFHSKGSVDVSPSVGKHLNVLVVEDDNTNMEILKSLLEYDGHRVFSAFSGSEAKNIFRPKETDCILTDIRLPDMTGVQLLRDLFEISQQSQLQREIPAIAVTANVMPEDLDEYKSAGFKGVVSKPIDERNLFGTMKAAIGATPNGELHEHVRDEGSDARLKEILGAEEFERIQAVFRNTLEECYSGIKEAVAGGNRDRIEFFCHRIAGSAASFGATNLANMAKSVEGRLTRDIDSDQIILKEMLKSCELVLKELGDNHGFN